MAGTRFGAQGQRVYPVPSEGTAPPEYAIDANRVGTRRFDLSTARDLHQEEIGGNVIWAVQASSLLASINIQFNEQRNDPIAFQLGMFVRGVSFSRLYISNDAQPGAYITLLYAREMAGNIQITNPSAQFNDVDISKASVLDSIADVSLVAASTTQIVAADATRREVIIRNLPTNSGTMRIGDSGAAAANGYPLEPGGSIILATTAAVYGYNPGAGAESVTVVEVKD